MLKSPVGSRQARITLRHSPHDAMRRACRDTPLFAVLDHKGRQYAIYGIEQVVFLTSDFALDENGCQV
jgi:hypothetical protein